MNTFTRLLLTFLFALLFASSVLAQTQDRVIFYDGLCEESSDDSEDEANKCLLELIDIQVAGKPVVSGKQFVADENWLKNLKIRVKNISGKPFVYVAVGFGLIEGLHEELAPSASWKYGFVFSSGKPSNQITKTKVSRKIVLKPNEEIELTYSNLPELYKQVLGKASEGTFSKSVFVSATVEFRNGEQKDSRLPVRNK